MSKSVCAICGATYNTKFDMKECYKSHAKVESFKKVRYKQYEKYPHRLDIQFEDGNTISFRRGW